MQPLVLSFEIHTFDIDFSGHVSNITYIRWMEVTRLKLVEAAGLSVREMADRRGVIPVLMETQISYKKALYFGETVRAEARIIELKPASAWVEYRFFNGNGDLAAVGRQKGIYLHKETLRPYRMTAEDRALLTPFYFPAASVESSPSAI
ncbi:MAG: acyl-CoA thioesterase [Capsulimonadales bacterium]|nr:acyl-CoA thioesterase [Capsulimonadales bacterium]